MATKVKLPKVKISKPNKTVNVDKVNEKPKTIESIVIEGESEKTVQPVNVVPVVTKIDNIEIAKVQSEDDFEVERMEKILIDFKITYNCNNITKFHLDNFKMKVSLLPLLEKRGKIKVTPTSNSGIFLMDFLEGQK